MNYTDLIECIHRFRLGEITRSEMIAAWGLWQALWVSGGVE